MTFSVEKLERYPIVKKSLKIRLLVLTECTYVIDGQTHKHTDTQMPHVDVGRACVASRGKNSIASDMCHEKRSLHISAFYCFSERYVVKAIVAMEDE